MKQALKRMQTVYRKQGEAKSGPGAVRLIFPDCEHDKGCKGKWSWEIDPKTGNVTLSCDKCKAEHVFEIGAVEE